MKAHVRKIVALLLSQRGDNYPFEDADSLVLSGRLESLAVMDLAVFLETTFGLDFARVEFNQTDFDSVDSIVALVSRYPRSA
jgi:acyl carrier protein